MEKIKGKLKYKYDPKADVLYSFINKPHPAKSLEMGNGIHIRVEPSSKKIVGFTVQDYAKRVLAGTFSSVPYFKHYKLPQPKHKHLLHVP